MVSATRAVSTACAPAAAAFNSSNAVMVSIAAPLSSIALLSIALFTAMAAMRVRNRRMSFGDNPSPVSSWST
ncbi:hypothetical protein [Rhodococcoides corynebacterioides]|uniref:hypothetical protein n=1 Tax=Rhodococcoides corynebacterioides TaxID=53972 RepID=UPI00200F8ACF|nr:hypothetical protein [Rhodococcus corynebacterioides]